VKLRIFLLNKSMINDATGMVRVDKPTNRGFTNTKALALILPDREVDCGMYGQTHVNLLGLTTITSAKLYLPWSVNVSTEEETAFSFKYKMYGLGQDTDFDLDVDSDESFVGQLSAAHLVPKRLRVKLITLDHTKFEDNKFIQYWLGRNNENADDDIAADLVVWSPFIEVTAS